MTLNQRSLMIISSTASALRSAYPSYDINVVELGDWRMRFRSIEITKGGYEFNKYMFFPDPNGNIASIALYGIQLPQHFRTIKQSGKIFGLPVFNIEMDGGLSDFIDIQIGEY